MTGVPKTTHEDQVRKLARQPLVLSTLRAIAGADSPVTPSILSTKLGKWGPNIARVLSDLRSMGLVEVERKGRVRLYQVPRSKKAKVQSIIEQATRQQASLEPADRSRSWLTESFYQDILYNALENNLPSGCGLSKNQRIEPKNSKPSLDMIISMNDGSRIGVELNVGPPGDHFYSTIGRTLIGSKDANLAMLIVVLLAPNSNDYSFPRLIRAGAERPISFGFICEDMPLKSEVAFGEDVARRITKLIEGRAAENKPGNTSSTGTS